LNNQSSSSNTKFFQKLFEKCNLFLYVLFCYKTLTNYLLYSNLGQFKSEAYSVMKSVKALLTKKTVFLLGFQTNNRLKERINRLFGFDCKSTIQNRFQTFSKTPKYKTIGCFNKQLVVFHLV